MGRLGEGMRERGEIQGERGREREMGVNARKNGEVSWNLLPTVRHDL